MQGNRRIRIVSKRDQQISEESKPQARPPLEREIKTVVSRWVKDHRARSEEFRQTFSLLLRTSGFQLPGR